MNTTLNTENVTEMHLERQTLLKYYKRVDILLDSFNKKERTKEQLEKEFLFLSNLLAKDNS